jgi:hypothetical protein
MDEKIKVGKGIFPLTSIHKIGWAFDKEKNQVSLALVLEYLLMIKNFVA